MKHTFVFETMKAAVKLEKRIHDFFEACEKCEKIDCQFCVYLKVLNTAE